MSTLTEHIREKAGEALKELYGLDTGEVEIQQTRKEFEGDLTLVIFPFLRASRKSPELTGREIGTYLEQNVEEIASFNVVKGFLNMSISDSHWLERLNEADADPAFGFVEKGVETIMVEYSSPNTNKPLHLGHVRNILLGYSVARLLEAAGKNVIKAQIINDRGIHICKSMVAWLRYGNGETPESSGLKGDKLVGKYYVEFDKAYKKEMEELAKEGRSDVKENAPIMLEAREMLTKWEQNDPGTISLWEKMNGWVYEGFEATYDKLGVDFDKYYYESNTYLLGKEIIEKGLEKGVFYKEEDGSVWVDLTDEGLDKKLLLRSDGTSVYMTQDIGTAVQRFEDFKDENLRGMIYTVGNEQDYHFKVLFIILKKLGYSWAENLYHLSYGMVDLPSGKMKSREGTVVDADDLIEEMREEARKISEELGKTEGMAEEQKDHLYHMVGMGALKYFILRVDPRKRMMFDPQESVDFQGNTGPFIQYTHARICSLLKKGESMGFGGTPEVGAYSSLQHSEKEVIKLLAQFPVVVQEAAREHSPAIVAAFVYDLVKVYNVFYQQLPVLTDEDRDAVNFRLKLSSNTAKIIKLGMDLLGVEVPERM